MAEEDSKFGFKDKEKALETLRLLESEETQYQKLTVRGLLGRAKRVLTSEFNVIVNYLCNIKNPVSSSDQKSRESGQHQSSHFRLRRLASEKWIRSVGY